MHPKLVTVLFLTALASGVSLALGAGILYENGPLPSYTGAPAVAKKPAEFNCTLCHLNFAWNNLNTPGGAVEILDLPQTYNVGLVYPIRVRLSTDSTAAFPERCWGFQITAVRASNGEGCGTFVLPDPDSMRVVAAADGEYPGFGSRTYAEQTALGDHDGLASPVEWRLSWRAPNIPQGSVYFFCAGNATNGNQDPGGDFVFTTSEMVLDTTTAVRHLSWGSLKQRYR